MNDKERNARTVRELQDAMNHANTLERCAGCVAALAVAANDLRCRGELDTYAGRNIYAAFESAAELLRGITPDNRARTSTGIHEAFGRALSIADGNLERDNPARVALFTAAGLHPNA
jgi:hypothetical protein